MKAVLRALFLALSCCTFTVAAGGATFIVSNTGDAGPGSLPQALVDANNNANPSETDLIQFAIPGPGPHTIQPLGELAAYQPVIIDGATQPGYAGLPLIVIDGTAAGVVVSGLNLQAPDGGSIIRGLVINNFDGRGINLYSDNNLVEHCYVGTDITGTVAQGNDAAGVVIVAQTGNIIRGNLISGNEIGIGIFGFNHDNLVQSNLIGTDITGTAKLGNTSDGIQIAGRNNTVEGNVISGNDGAGVYLVDPSTTGNVVEENFIGTDRTGMAGLGNAGAGVWIDGAAQNRIGTSGSGNLISGNGSDGVYVFNGKDNSVQGNRIGSDITGNAVLGNGGHGVFLRNARRIYQAIPALWSWSPTASIPASTSPPRPLIPTETHPNSAPPFQWQDKAGLRSRSRRIRPFTNWRSHGGTVRDGLKLQRRPYGRFRELVVSRARKPRVVRPDQE